MRQLLREMNGFVHGVFVIILVLLVVGYITIDNHLEDHRLAAVSTARSNTVMSDVRLIHNELLRAESAQRGFLLTRDSERLATFQEIRADLPQLLDQLAGSLAEDPVQLQRLRQLRVLVETRLRELVARVDEVANQTLTGDLIRQRISQETDRLGEDVARLIESMAAAETTTLQNRLQRQQQTKELVDQILMGEVLLIALALMIFYGMILLYTYRQRMQLRENQLQAALASFAEDRASQAIAVDVLAVLKRYVPFSAATLYRHSKDQLTVLAEDSSGAYLPAKTSVRRLRAITPPAAKPICRIILWSAAGMRKL